MVEVAGVEPASLERSNTASTYLAFLLKIRFLHAEEHAC